MDKLTKLVGIGPVLVLAPHADDEALGCGALLSACWRRGISTHVVCLTDGAASHPHSAEDIATIRAAELVRSISILGGDPEHDLTCLNYPDTALRQVPEAHVTMKLTSLVDRMNIALLIAPSPLDPHADHIAAATLAEQVVAARPHLRLLFYPIWARWAGGGQAPHVPGTRRRTFDPIEPAKMHAIAAHASQRGGVIRDDPDGFAMPDGFAEMFAAGPEIYDERVA